MANPEYAKMQSFSKYFKILLVGLLLSLIISIIILSSVPPVSRDALTHHLAVPKLYLKHCSIYEIPDLKCSYYPMNLDLLYLISLYFRNDIIPKYIHFSFALLTAWLIFSYLKRRIDRLYALLGVILFLSLPVIIKLSITVYVDLGLIFFSTASLIYLLKWIETDFKIKYLVISAIWCGFALGTKYNGLIVLFLLTLFVPFIYLRSVRGETSRQIKAIGYCAAFVLISLIIFSPWMIRNNTWTGNPIYPLYESFFNPKKVVPIITKAPDTDSSDSTNNASDVVKKPKGRWGHFAVRKIVYGEKWWETALIPVRVFFQGKDDNPKYFDGRLNPILFIFPFFAFIRIKKNDQSFRTEKKIFFAFAVLFLLYAFVQTDMRIRYISPIIAPLVILSVFGMHEIITVIKKKYSGNTRGLLKGCVFAFVTFLVSLNAVYIIKQFNIIDPMSYISGRVGRNEYIEKYRPEYAAINYANHNTPDNAKILCLFLGNRGYYFDREIAFNFDLVSKVVLQEGSLDKILVDLERRRITHILVRYDLFSKWLQDNYNEREKEVINKFFKKHVKLLYSKNGHGLYRLKKQVIEDG
ncbi:MAG: glycosyltransferase family 39 protein [Deltaproteobacteria bacterium]|nr:glycosyltransferase family 39 protein [Deltaproteobacteria bacterium]